MIHLPSATSDSTVSVTIDKAIDPYFEVLFAARDLATETRSEFISRHVKLRIMESYADYHLAIEQAARQLSRQTLNKELEELKLL